MMCGSTGYCVDTCALPLSLLERFTGKASEWMLDLLRFLQPLTAAQGSTKAM